MCTCTLGDILQCSLFICSLSVTLSLFFLFLLFFYFPVLTSSLPLSLSCFFSVSCLPTHFLIFKNFSLLFPISFHFLSLSLSASLSCFFYLPLFFLTHSCIRPDLSLREYVQASLNMTLARSLCVETWNLFLLKFFDFPKGSIGHNRVRNLPWDRTWKLRN